MGRMDWRRKWWLERHSSDRENEGKDARLGENWETSGLNLLFLIKGT